MGAAGRQRPFASLRLVCTTGEPLADDQRALINEVFGAPVASEYGCRDGGRYCGVEFFCCFYCGCCRCG